MLRTAVDSSRLSISIEIVHPPSWDHKAGWTVLIAAFYDHIATLKETEPIVGIHCSPDSLSLYTTRGRDHGPFNKKSIWDIFFGGSASVFSIGWGAGWNGTEALLYVAASCVHDLQLRSIRKLCLSGADSGIQGIIIASDIVKIISLFPDVEHLYDCMGNTLIRDDYGGLLHTLLPRLQSLWVTWFLVFEQETAEPHVREF